MKLLALPVAWLTLYFNDVFLAYLLATASIVLFHIFFSRLADMQPATLPGGK